MNQQAMQQLTQPLLTWYGENGRTLPWRGSGDPYRIWISEIMLQQTRVAAVLGYYARFLENFPTVEALAAADEERLFKLWEGLGYYSRARNLQKTARILTADFGGKFPDTYEGLTALPGIGDYTAGAILSLAFSRRIPAVDGNVLRVVARVTDCREDIGDPKVKKMVREWVLSAMPEEARSGLYNQAIMDLGATVCLPNGKPLCEACPAGAFCAGRQAGSPEKLPVKKPKAKRRTEERTVWVLLSPAGVALQKRPETGLLAGLWEFPNLPGHRDETAAAAQVADWGLTVTDWRRQLTAKHIFTHVEWHMTGYVLQVDGPGTADFFWADGAALDTLAVPSAFAKFLPEAKDAGKES